MRRIRWAFGALALLLASCATGHSADFGLLAPASPPGVQELVARDVGARTCQRWYARLEPAESDALLARAAAEALEQAPGANALANLTIESRSLLLLLYNRSCTEVRADAVRVVPVSGPGAAGPSEPRPGTP